MELLDSGNYTVSFRSFTIIDMRYLNGQMTDKCMLKVIKFIILRIGHRDW